jgi:hypothetical protein
MATAHEHKMPTAHSLQEAANADNSLEGYASINYVDEHSEIARLAYQFYEERNGENGSAEADWHRAEKEWRTRRPERQPR